MKNLLESFLNAIRGIAHAAEHERNFLLELVIAVPVLCAAYLLPLSLAERLVVILTIFWVLTLELANTAIERLADVIEPNLHPSIRIVKDVMAGAVLLAAVAAIVIGVFVFLPYITM